LQPKNGKVHFEKGKNSKQWSPYGCHYYPETSTFPQPNLDSLPKEPLKRGEQYFLDLAGNICKVKYSFVPIPGLSFFQYLSIFFSKISSYNQHFYLTRIFFASLLQNFGPKILSKLSLLY